MPAAATVDRAADGRVRRQFRAGAWVGAVVAVLVGLFGLVFPQTALGFGALFIGVYLVVSGVLRLITAIGSAEVATPVRWLLGAVGALLVIGGILALNNPFGTLVALVIVLGASWLVDGIGYLVAALTVRRTRGWWAMALGGVLLAIAGVVILASSLTALATLFFFFSLMLLVFGAVSIVVLGLTGARR